MRVIKVPVALLAKKFTESRCMDEKIFTRRLWSTWQEILLRTMPYTELKAVENSLMAKIAKIICKSIP